MAGRRSVRRFLPTPVSETLVAELVAAATRAPSAHNRQPWRFHVVRDAAGKANLAKAMGDRLHADRSRDGDDAESIAQDVARSSARINGAGALIAVCLTLEEMDTYPDAKRNEAEYIMAVQSTAMAAQIALLKAQAAGLGACWVCAPLFCPDTVRAALGLRDSWRPQGLILLGWPAEPGRDRPRKPLTEILTGIDLA
ncbi:MAG TPA: nitroreductase family protein [Alphaproteobacteria bacterium]|nr:nitroreductase family protein [Alphaproteobacteria bacterium]